MSCSDQGKTCPTCTHLKYETRFGHHSSIRTKAFEMLVEKSVKPKTHFMGGVMERSKALSSGGETENNKTDMLMLTMYMKEPTLIFLRR